jgi:hypothetical protein
MKAEEIRKLVGESRMSKTVTKERAPLGDVLLAEIAAQLAELNDRLAMVTTPGCEIAVRRYEAGVRK